MIIYQNEQQRHAARCRNATFRECGTSDYYTPAQRCTPLGTSQRIEALLCKKKTHIAPLVAHQGGLGPSPICRFTEQMHDYF